MQASLLFCVRFALTLQKIKIVSKIVKRSITGTIYVALLVLAITVGDIFFTFVFGLILILGILELSNLLSQKERQLPLFTALDIVGGLSLFLTSYLANEYPGAVNPLLCYLPYILVRSVAQLYVKNSNAIISLAISAFTQIYIALPISLLNSIYFDYGTPYLLLICLIFIWINDTGAFCVGSMIGKHKLFTRISPKKTWEGFFGGLIFNIAAAIAFSELLCPEIAESFSTAGWIAFAAIVTVFSTWGDLIESLIKRSAGVKDSGTILPGHGGVLDRIDSLLLVAPASLIYFYIML